MKKSLLSLCALSLAVTANAASEAALIIEEPFIMPSSIIMGFSPNKTVAVGEYFGNLFIYDLASDEEPLIFQASEDGLTYNSCGLGNFVGNNTLCASRGAEHGVEAYLWGNTGVLNGRFIAISNEVKGGLGASNGVTPDGTRICGNTPTGEEFGIDAENTMVLPALWERKGNTFTRTMLPCPETDYLGLKPQYVTALSISDDGKTIIGQLVSNNGFLTEFLLYTQAEDGTWSYRRPFDSLVNPDKLEIPEYPGEGPEVPTIEKYMTEEEYNAYLEALTAYNQNPEGEEPKVQDFMTTEEYAAYVAALEPYLVWLAKYEEYEKVEQQIREKSISFEFNLNALSPNGRYLASSAVETYFVGLTRTSKYTPVLYDIVEDRIIVSDGPDIRVTAVSDNGDVLGFTRDMFNGIDLGYVLLAGTTEWMPLEEYVVMRNPSVAQWIEDNWKREVELIVDPDEYITDYQTLYITGMPMISRDFTLLSTIAFNYWEATEELPNDYNSYIIPLVEAESAIEEIESADNANAPVEYFNLQGVRINEPENGIFIRRQGSDVSKIRK